MKHFYLFITFLVLSITGFSQYSRHIIELRDKKGTAHSISNPTTYLSAKAIARRTAARIAIDSTDLPLSSPYLDSIAAVPNVVIYNKSKWLNQVLIRTNDPAALVKINSFSFVRSTKRIAVNAAGVAAPVELLPRPGSLSTSDRRVTHGQITVDEPSIQVASSSDKSTPLLPIGRSLPNKFAIEEGETGISAATGSLGATVINRTTITNEETSTNRVTKTNGVTSTNRVTTSYGNTGTSDITGTFALSYGNSWGQIHIHEGEFLHNKGYTGQDIEMAVMDAGFFSYKTNPAFDSVRLQNRILGTWDYVANEESVNEDHNHGADCFSIIAANRPGSIVGSAPHAKFWLFRTEDVASETPVEEQNWIAAAEFADSAGVRMFSTSLGYFDFDDPSLNYSHAQRDGNTAMMTRAADLAAKKGILIMNSAGNFGNLAGDAKYVAVPADGDSVIAVGAVDVNGTIGFFSSVGPNGAGKIKPNIVSVGVGTVFAPASGNPASGNGTSFSNPNIAGLIACLWQAFPESTNMQIVDAVQRSSHKFHNPDAIYGYGIPNLRKAYNILMAQSFKPLFTYKNAIAELSWSMNADTSVSFVIEKKIPGASGFIVVDSFHNTHANLTFDSYVHSDTIRTTTPGNYTYRIRVVIANDTSFTSEEYAFTNAWSSLVADSLKFNTSFASCVTNAQWVMKDDSNTVYKLERRLPGTTAFTTVYSVRGSGTFNAAAKQYTYNDPISAPVTGTFDYRLQVSLGTDTSFYSKTSSFVSLAPCFSRKGYYFTPSPFDKDIYAVMTGGETLVKLNIIVYDALGRIVYRYTGSKPGGYYSVKISTSNLAKGAYTATILDGNQTVHTQKLVK